MYCFCKNIYLLYNDFGMIEIYILNFIRRLNIHKFFGKEFSLRQEVDWCGKFCAHALAEKLQRSCASFGFLHTSLYFLSEGDRVCESLRICSEREIAHVLIIVYLYIPYFVHSIFECYTVQILKFFL